MTLKEKEQLRNIILLILEAGRPGLTLREVSNKAQLRDFNNPDSDFADALDWLTAHGFAEEIRVGIGKLTRAWRISDAGVEYLDGANL